MVKQTPEIINSLFLNRNPFEIPLVVVTMLAVVMGPMRKLVLAAVEFVFGLLRKALLCLQTRFSQPQPKQQRNVLWGLAALFLVGFSFFEYEFQVNRCVVSPEYYKENIRVFHSTLDFLEANKLDHWLEYGSALEASRSDTFVPWSHDSDIGVFNPDGDAFVARLRALIQEQTPFVTYYDPPRDLVQVYEKGAPMHGPHVDLYLARPFTDGDESFVHVIDDGPGYTWRPATFIWPLKKRFFTGRNVSVMNGLHAYMRMHFGNNYKTPLAYRADCVHNVVHARTSYVKP